MSISIVLKIQPKVSIVVGLFIVWLVASGIIIYRINTRGAYASIGSTDALNYIKEVGQADPASVRLNQSYSQWALALNMSDPSNYIKTGLGFAEGKGVSLKNITPEDPHSNKYLAYYFQAPGTAIVIGTMIKLFGEQSVWPYFILIAGIHFITALLTCILASRFIKEDVYIFAVGLLSLLSLPILDFTFGVGLFSSEPLAAPFIVISLIAISNFWAGVRNNAFSLKVVCLSALVFGGALGCAAYFRDVYAIFAKFSFAILILIGLLQRNRLKQVALFVLISSIVLFAIQYPWEKRNQRHFGEFTMSGSGYCSTGLWDQIWSDYKESAKWSGNAAMGLGNYLAPEKTAPVIGLLSANKQQGNKYAWQCLIEAICKKPSQAIWFKLRAYDCLWFGQRQYWYIYAWCLLSTLSFFVFLWMTRFKFIPEIWLFPLFLLCISPLIHYEHRYAHPFLFFLTPIAAMYVVRYWRSKDHLVV